MPQEITPQTRERYIAALRMRDDGFTFREIASCLNYADPATARYAWIGGLRLAGRNAEIPTRTPRNVTVQFNTHQGRVTRTVAIENMATFNTDSTLTFGIEIECVGLDTSVAARALHNGGISCRDTGYTHGHMDTWKVVPDGSLSSRGGGSCEVVSPILRGSDGLAEVRSVMKLLREAGATTNASCGMHIHIGVNTLTQSQQANVIRAYHHWQGAFVPFLATRRLTSSYSKFRSTGAADLIADAWEQGGMQNAYAMRSAGDRYYAMNLASFQRYGTFEFRSHQGSLNGTNAAAWIAMHLAFVDSAANNGITAAMATDCNGASLMPNPSQQYDIDRGWNFAAARLAEHKDAALYMNAHLKMLGYLQSEACDYLRTRAGNVPASGRNS